MVALACREQTTPPPPAAPQAAFAEPEEGANLLNIAFGGSVVSRTAELTLDHSAARAIDGDPASGWASPPDDTRQTIVFALAAPARIEKVGVLPYVAPQTTAKTVTFEASADGRSFVTVAAASPQPKPELQLVDIEPVTARYVRVTAGKTDSLYSGFAAVQVRGAFLEEPSVAPLAACWSINGFPASIDSRDGRLAGVLRSSSTPISFEGSAEGAVYRMTWSRGPEAGVALVTLSPDGRNLTGAKWYEEPIPVFYGDSWFGERAACGEKGRFVSPMPAWIRQRGHYPLYTLQFDRDDHLTGGVASDAAVTAIAEAVRRAEKHRVRLASREFREKSPDANLRRSQRRLESLRAALAKQGVEVANIDFQASGSERPYAAIATESMRVLYSAIDIEVPEAARSLF